MILRRPSLSCGVPPNQRARGERVRVGGERRVSLARHRDVGTQHLTTTPSASSPGRTPEEHAAAKAGSGQRRRRTRTAPLRVGLAGTPCPNMRDAVSRSMASRADLS
jgi:hypothetical protein